MNNPISIRGYLTIINFIVTALIILLVSGFIANGKQKAYEGQNLSRSVKIESLATTFLKAASAEKRLSHTLTHRDKAPDPEELQRNLDFGRNSDLAANHLVQEIDNLLKSNKQYFKGTRYSEQVAKQTFQYLRALIERLQVYRSYTSAELLKPIDKRDHTVQQLVPDTLSQSIEWTVKIVENLSFLPSQDAALVDRYKELSARYWKLYRDITEYDQLLTALNFAKILPGSRTLEQFTAYESRIESGWKELLQSNVTDDFKATLLTHTSQTRTLYYNTHNKYITQMKAATQYGFYQYISPTDWENSIENVRSGQQAIIDSVHKKMDEIGVDLHRSAGRSLSVMAIILVISLVSSFLLFWLGRRIKQQADTDNLTKLSNRFIFESALQQSNHGDATKIRQTVFLIDIKNFKKFNDNYGHKAGDQLLIEVAGRVKNACSEHLVARIGDDDFAVHMNNISKEVKVESLAQHILDSVNGNFELNGAMTLIEASIGYAVSPDDSPAGTDLLKNAEIAYYRNKVSEQRSSNQNIARFNSIIGDQHVKRRQLERNILNAIDNQEFTLHYQPKVCTATCTVRSVEALIRWQRQDSTIVSPAEFIPIAEELGLMEKIGTFVLEKACLDIATMHKKGFAGLGVAVNISSQQFMDELFCEKVIRSADRAQLRAGFLELEVTESIVMHDIDRVTELLKSLRSTGITIAIDDFGTGYSCLSHLQDLPLDTLKIDRAFVDKLDKTLPHQTVANSIVQLAVLFGLTTVAEGVENDAQRHEVAQLGIDLIQGYHYSKPVPLNELPRVIHEIENLPSSLTTISPNRTQPGESRDDNDEDTDEDNMFNKAA